MSNTIPKSPKIDSIIPVICGLLIAYLCLYMVKEALSVFFPPEVPDAANLPPESLWVTDATKSIAEKYPNYQQKGRIGATFFIVLGGFGLLFFGGGTLLVIYRTWISPPPPRSK